MFPQRNILKLMAIVFCTRLHFYLHAYALFLQGQGLSLLQISTIESVVIGTVFVMEVPTGVLADSLGRKWSLVAWVALMCAAETLFLFSRSYPLYLLVGFLTGTGFAFSSGALDALVYDSLPPENRDQNMAQVMGRIGSLGQFAFFISPLLGGIILGDLAQARFWVAIALTAFVLFIGVMISLTLQEPPTDHHAPKKQPLQVLRAGIAEVRRNRPLRRLALLMMLTSPFGAALVTTLAPPYLAQQQVAPYAIGLVLSLGSLLAIGVQRYAYLLEAKFGQAGFAIALLLPGFSYLILGRLTGALTVWAWLIFMYGTNDLRAPLLSARQNALIDGQARATVLSLTNMANSLFLALVAPIYAALGERSLSLAFTVMGLVILGSGLAHYHYITGFISASADR